MSEPKILLWDIETTHNIVAAFNLFDDYTSPDNILQERYIVCAAWKWLGDKETHVVSVLDDPKLYAKDPHNDLHVLKALHKVLSEADIIVAHNGDKFDIKQTEARMIMQGLPPLPPITSVDTLKVAKKRFRFNANKLDYLGHILGCGRKMKTTPGLWLEVLKGNAEAVKKMAKYNKADVKLLEKVFKKLRPYITKPLMRVEGCACSRCGSTKVQSRGTAKTATREYQRFQCKDCGGWFQSVKAEKSFQEVKPIG